MWEKKRTIDDTIDCMCMTVFVATILPLVASYDIGCELGMCYVRRMASVPPLPPSRPPPRRSARLAAKAAILQK